MAEVEVEARSTAAEFGGEKREREKRNLFMFSHVLLRRARKGGGEGERCLSIISVTLFRERKKKRVVEVAVEGKLKRSLFR